MFGPCVWGLRTEKQGATYYNSVFGFKYTLGSGQVCKRTFQPKQYHEEQVQNKVL